MKRHDKLCHGDFNPSNIIVTANDDVYIIDWAHATQGNASADVARTYLLFYLNGKEEFADKYLNLFCERTDTAKQYVQKWLPIVAASQSVKGNKEEVGLLSRWVNVVDYMYIKLYFRQYLLVLPLFCLKKKCYNIEMY